MARLSRRVCSIGLASIVCACGQTPAPVSSGVTGSAACPPGEDATGWAAGEYAIAHQSPAAFEVERVGGIAATPTAVYVWDPTDPVVWKLDPMLRAGVRIGRSGEGPGEFTATRVRPSLGGGSWRWIVASADSLVVFDGRRLTVLDTTGRPRRTRVLEGGIAALGYLNGRLALHVGALLYGVGGYDVSVARDPGEATFRVLRDRGRSSAVVVSLTLAALPRNRAGIVSVPSEQARPLWDVAGGCVVATDGAGTWLVAAGVGGGPADTVVFAPVELPPPVGPPGSEASLLAEVSGAAAGRLAPTAPRLYSDLVVDPDGVAWLLPLHGLREDGRVIVDRVRIRTGAVERVELPAFPGAFGPPGTYYGVVRDSLGVQSVVRVERSGARP